MDTTPAEATKAIFDFGEEKRAEGRAEASKEHARMVREFVALIVDRRGHAVEAVPVTNGPHGPQPEPQAVDGAVGCVAIGLQRLGIEKGAK